jgi:3-hydroxyacyl-CoA dehydrogenase
MATVHYEVTGGVAVLRLDNPPVNSFGVEMRGLIVAGVARAEADPGVGP